MDLKSEIVTPLDRDGCEMGVKKKYRVDENERKMLKIENLERSKINSVRFKSETQKFGNEIWW